MGFRLFYSPPRMSEQCAEPTELQKKTNKKTCSEILFSEQLVSDAENLVNGEHCSYLTFQQYQCMSSEEKSRIQNRVRQWALKARECLPSDHGVFCLVVAHLLKNAHRYFKLKKPSEMQEKVLEEKSISDATREKVVQEFKVINKKMRQVAGLRSKKRIDEQQQIAGELKLNCKTYRNMSFMSGIPLKTVHEWCSLPKSKTHKLTELSRLRRKEFESFLVQESVSFSHPSKRLSGKRFLRDTLEVTRRKYLAQPEFHMHGVISMSTMKKYRPPYIMLCGKTPLNQCLCDTCENTEQLLRALQAIGMQEIPSNRYQTIDKIVCSDRHRQHGTEFEYPKMDCLLGNCENCGEEELERVILNANESFLVPGRHIS